eukprot:CAMPEP_0172476314 /NCGR_PEP_ID=MMETSP1065-20121228/70316_1 /TAXON_ID=265537 /ORGANISM="Amphiprora paludosa, Strain CCMP125" /LENGTH=147 /DNA_ID=CAMNT_0013234535 /DNA_START=270 /DNA_END=713 /DNA_ORIENTATION=+
MTSPDQNDWMERTTGKMSRSISKLMHNNACFRLCSVYAEEQVEYENRQQDDYVVSGIDRMMQSALGQVGKSTLEVQVYKQFLFDEESVLEGVRQEEEEEEVSLNHADCDSYGEEVSPSRRRGRSGMTIDGVKSQDTADDLTFLTQRS